MINQVSRRRMVRLMMRRLVPWWIIRETKDGKALLVVNTSKAMNLNDMTNWTEGDIRSQWWVEGIMSRQDYALFLHLEFKGCGLHHQFALGFSMREHWKWLQALSRSLTLYLGFATEKPEAGEMVYSIALPVSDRLRMLLVTATKKEA